MPIRNLRRAATVLGTATPASAPIFVDSDDNQVKLIPAGSGTTEVTLLTTAGTQTTTTNIGAIVSGVTAQEFGDAFFHRTVLTLNAFAITLADATASGTGKIYDFPEGSISILGGWCSLAETTTSAIATTLNSGVTLNVAVGSTATADATLATTEVNMISSFNVTSSATINVAGAASEGAGPVACVGLNGAATPIDAILNVAVPTGTDIDLDATTTWSGTVTLIWTFNGNA